MSFTLGNINMGGGLNTADKKVTPEEKGFTIGKIDTTAETPRPFSDVEEVTIDNPKYYPITQPYVPRVLIKFPQITSDSASSITTATLSMSASDQNYLEIRPQNLISFEYTGVPNGPGQIKLSLFDPTWGSIEETLVKNRGLFTLKFGYPDKLMSPWFKILTTGYSLEFKQAGIIIHIFGVANGFEANIEKKFKGFGEKNQLISDIVKQIADDLISSGSLEIKPENIFIEKTASVFTRDSIKNPELVQKVFQQAGQTDYEFIVNVLAKYAISEDAQQGNYQFYIDTNPDTNETEFHFHTMYYKLNKGQASPPQTSSPSQFSITGTGLDTRGPGAVSSSAAALPKVPAFTMFRDKNSALINFSPLWEQTAANLSGGAGSFSSVIDLNKSTLSQVKTVQDTPIQTDNRGGANNNVSTLKADESQVWPKKMTAIYVPGSNAMLQGIQEINKQTKIAIGALDAEIEIVGNPKYFRFFDKIAVLIFSPTQNSESQKIVHWMSGYFRIQGVTHSITAGKYTTKFHIITAGREAIYTDPLQTIPSKQ